MRWSIPVAFGLVGLIVLILANPALSEDPAAAKPNIVQIDVSKLPPDVARRLLDELAKQKKPEAPVADRADAKGDARAKGDAKMRGEEKPSKGKAKKGADGKGRVQPGARPGDKKPEEKDKKPEK